MSETAWALYLTLVIAASILMYMGIQGPCSIHTAGTPLALICEGRQGYQR